MPFDEAPLGRSTDNGSGRETQMSLQALRRREGNELHVRGVDMLDGTPILDIKAYLSSIPAERLRRGWLGEAEARQR